MHFPNNVWQIYEVFGHQSWYVKYTTPYNFMYCNVIPVEWSTEEMPISVAINVRRFNQILRCLTRNQKTRYCFTHSTVRNIFVFWNLAFLNQKQWFWRLGSSRRILVLIWSIPISKMTHFNWEMLYLKKRKYF